MAASLTCCVPVCVVSCRVVCALLCGHQHEELREKLRIVRTVLEQGGTFSGINRKVQLKPTKWSNPTTTNSSSNNKQDTPEQPQQQPQGAGDQQQQQGGQGQPSKAAGVDGSKSTGASSSGGAPAAAAADIKPEVTELLLILKYGGTLTHAGRTQAEELGKTFRMIMYPRCVVNAQLEHEGCVCCLFIAMHGACVNSMLRSLSPANVCA